MSLIGSANAATSITLTSLNNPGKYIAVPNADAGWNNVLDNYDSKAKVNVTNEGLGFWTFCLEYDQHYTSGSTYDAAFSLAADGPGGTSPDTISVGTAHLYELFAKGTLYAGANYTTDQGEKLQRMIWSLEGETGGVVDSYLAGLLPSNYLDNYTGTSVGVLNLTQTSGNNVTYHQDQLVYRGGSQPPPGGSVPDGGTSLVLLALSLGGLGIARRCVRA